MAHASIWGTFDLLVSKIHIGVIPCTCRKRFGNLKTTHLSANKSDILHSGTRLAHIEGTFDFVVGNVVFRLFGACVSNWYDGTYV